MHSLPSLFFLLPCLGCFELPNVGSGNKLRSFARVVCAYTAEPHLQLCFLHLSLHISNTLPFSCPFIVPEFHIREKIYPVCFCETSLFQLTG